MYVIVTEWTDGTVDTTVIETGGSIATGVLSQDDLDRACWQVAASIEQDESGIVDKTRIHQAHGTVTDDTLPWYRIADDPETDDPIDVYVRQAGTVSIG